MTSSKYNLYCTHSYHSPQGFTLYSQTEKQLSNVAYLNTIDYQYEILPKPMFSFKPNWLNRIKDVGNTAYRYCIIMKMYHQSRATNYNLMAPKIWNWTNYI